MRKIILMTALCLSWDAVYAYRTLQDMDFTSPHPLSPQISLGVSSNALMPLLQEAASEVIAQEVEIILETQTLPLSQDALADASITDFTPQKDGVRFRAHVQASSLKEPLILEGKFYPIKEIPVLKRLPAPGEPITEQDLEWKKVALRKLSRTTLTKTEDILGCLVRAQHLTLGAPLRSMDLEKPLYVKRGEAVLITVQDSKISLELEGTALEQGEKGQRIRVLNPMSKRTLHGIVTDHKRVEIERPLRLAQTLEGSQS